MQLKTGLFLSIVSLITGCNSATPQEVYNVEANDPEMLMAAKKARSTLPHFLSVLQKHDSTFYNFAVKLPFDADGRNEYIWLGEPTFENGKWYGTVDNTPEYTQAVKEGEKVEWDTSRVADWNYTLNGELIGGYSVRVLRNRMTTEERAEFDKSTGWIIK